MQNAYIDYIKYHLTVCLDVYIHVLRHSIGFKLSYSASTLTSIYTAENRCPQVFHSVDSQEHSEWRAERCSGSCAYIKHRSSKQCDPLHLPIPTNIDWYGNAQINLDIIYNTSKWNIFPLECSRTWTISTINSVNRNFPHPHVNLKQLNSQLINNDGIPSQHSGKNTLKYSFTHTKAVESIHLIN